MRAERRIALEITLIAMLTLALAGAAWAQHSPQPPLDGPTFTVPGIVAGQPLKIVGYGDTRFTNVSNFVDTNPRVRQYLAKRIAAEKPDAIFMTGDLPFHGAVAADWQVYRDETAAWKAEHLRVYPTLGNHDVLGGWNVGVQNFDATFPELKGFVYYSVLIGNVYLITLDCTESYGEGSEQRAWLKAQLEHLPASVDFVFFLSHMPLYADIQSQVVASLPNPAELSLREFILSEAPQIHAKLVVLNGHIHNYERFESKNVSYIVSGGGGAMPYRVIIRGPEDLFQDSSYPNYHYLVFMIHGKTADVTMYRLTKWNEPSKTGVEVKDRFTLTAPEK
jgi:acid phosphatase type 7